MDFFLFRGNIWMGNGRFCDALIVRRGRIAALGRQQELYPLAEGCSFVDCGGRTVIPGFFDACLCLSAAGGSLPDGAEGLEEACKTWLTAHPRQAKKGAHLFWRSKGAQLSLQQMDRIWQTAPLVLEDIAQQTCWVNSAALEQLKRQGISATLVSMMSIDEQGDPTGRFWGSACRMVASLIPKPSQLQQKEFFRSWLRQAGEAGITTVQSIDLVLQTDNKLLPILQQLYREDHHLPRMQFFIPERQKIRSDRPQTPEKQPSFSGKLIGFTNMINKRKNDGQSVVSIESHSKLAELLEYLRQHPLPSGNPQRMTLLGCAAADQRQLQELGNAGLGIIVFPSQLETSLRACAAQTGVQLETCCAWRTLSSLGAKIAFGGLDHMTPFEGMQQAVARKTVTVSGESIPSKEALSREAALEAMTGGAAWTDFQEGYTGRLQAGFRADLQVLDGDPFTCPEDQIGQIRPVLVMAGGKILLRKI